MKSNLRKYIFLALLIALFVEVLVVFPNKVNQEKKAETAASATENGTTEANEPQAPHSEQLMKGVHLVESQKGSRDWELFSSESEGGSGKDQSNWKLKKIRVLFYTNEKVEFTVTGDEGNIDGKSRDMSIRGHVLTTSANGYSFKTEDVTYRSSLRLISSSGPVVMTGPRDKEGEELHVNGQRMQIEVDTGLMRIPESVAARKRLNTGMQMTLTSNTAEFSGRNKEARFIGNVLMNYDQFKLEGTEVKFMQSSGGNFLSNVQFSGGVKLRGADKFATSEKLNFDFLANKLVLDGKPKVYQNGDELSGDQIIFLEGGKKVKVEKVRASSKDK